MKEFNLTEHQKAVLAEYDDQEKQLEQQINRVRESRREFINTNQLNEKVGTVK